MFQYLFFYVSIYLSRLMHANKFIIFYKMRFHTEIDKMNRTKVKTNNVNFDVTQIRVEITPDLILQNKAWKERTKLYNYTRPYVNKNVLKSKIQQQTKLSQKVADLKPPKNNICNFD